MAKPSTLPRWADLADPSDIVEPSEARKDAGWPVGYRPPSQIFNWWKNTVYQWAKYLDTLPTEALTWTAGQVSAVADAAIPAWDLTTPMGSAARRLALRGFYFQASTQKGRLYFAHPDTIELSFNCAWNGTAWVPDVNGTCSLYQFGVSGRRTYRVVGQVAGTPFSFTNADNFIAPATTALGSLHASFAAAAGNSAPRYWVDGDGMIHLMGKVTVSAGTGAVAIYAAGALPVGFRPLASRFFPVTVVSGSTAAWNLEVLASGGMNLANATALVTSDAVYLDGVTFRAEQ